MRKTFAALVMLTAVGLTLPGSASAQTKIVIGIPTSPPNIVHMPPIVAKELGLYKKAGHRRRDRVAWRWYEGFPRLARWKYRLWA